MKICPTCQHTYPDDFSLCPRDGAHLTSPATETEAQLAAGLSRRFRLIRRLGKGGMGTVFLAEQIGVGNRPVALKVLNRKLLDDPDFLVRFQNEAGSTGRIHHPNVVTIHESAQSDDGTPYIAMEFLEGESLREVIKQRGALPLPEVTEILQQAGRGLNAAHKLGIIHRDLKPDNIFLTRSDEGELIVKVVDFGIAKLRESTAHTMTGTVLGTPAYMSFEQASGMRSDELDARSDIYSMGVVVYEMLTGRTPFHSDTPVGYLRKHLMEEPPPFRAVEPGLLVPPRIESVVMKALTKDRTRRYSSVLEFAQEFAQAVGAGPHPAAQRAPQREAVKPEPQTRVAPVPKTIVPATAGHTVAAEAVPVTAHRSHWKWLGLSWKRLAIVASIVWILGAGCWGLKFQSDDDLERINTFCHATTPGSGPEYEKCLNDKNAEYVKFVPEERELAASFAFIPVLLGWGFIYLVLFLVRRISRAAIDHPSKRKWLASNWKRIGIVASVIWILSMGIQSYKGASDSDSRLAAMLKQSCIDDKEKEEPEYSKCLREADAISHFYSPQETATQKQGCIDTKDKIATQYNECINRVDAVAAKQLPGHLKDAAEITSIPALLGWGFAYLLLFLVRRNIRSLAAAKPPQLRTISKQPNKMTFVIMVGVALILVVAGTWYFSRRGAIKGDARLEAPQVAESDRTCKDWEQKHPIGSPLDIVTYPNHVTPGPESVPDGAILGPLDTCLGPLEDAYRKKMNDYFQSKGQSAGLVSQTPSRPKTPDDATVPPGQKPSVGAPVVGIGPKPREVRVNPKDGLTYVWIPRGTFVMGCSPGDRQCNDDEKPGHRVTITKGFWLGQTEVTVGAYKRFAAGTGKVMPSAPDFNPDWSNEQMPLVDVSWDEAMAFCGWAGGRLPTEAEWEYAARAGSNAARYGNLDEIAWYADNSGRERLDSIRIRKENLLDWGRHIRENGNGGHEVGQKRANLSGLYDMLGNVWEWVNDWYGKKYYQNSPSQDPPGPASGRTRTLRGGSWRDLAENVGVSYRAEMSPESRFNDDFGFRCGGEVFAP